MEVKKCSFTGHRPEKLPWGGNEADPRCEALKALIYSAVEKAYAQGYKYFICGMARGCDMYFFDALCRLRRSCGDITIEAALPCERQWAMWNAGDKQRWQEAIALCDVITPVNKDYSKDCFALRNKYMVDCSDLLISVYDGEGGGTGSTVAYARRKGVEIVSLWL